MGAYLCYAECSDVLTVRGGAISSPPKCSQDTANSLHSYTSVYGVVGWRRCAGQAGTSIVVTDWFHDWCQDACHHTQHWRHTHCGHSPLTWGYTGGIRVQTFWNLHQDKDCYQMTRGGKDKHGNHDHMEKWQHANWPQCIRHAKHLVPNVSLDLYKVNLSLQSQQKLKWLYNKTQITPLVCLWVCHPGQSHPKRAETVKENQKHMAVFCFFF